ncbi:TrbC/VirB2 family protein [Blastomonas sp.]|uniref:TrbC/VirB2 family protein n=1 Tax=Blastomonas sp. TaxID=1909299 RepID=UPI00391AB1C6
MDSYDPFATSVEAGALATAAAWVQAALTGTIAVSIAVIAIAAVGAGMMSGRIDIRRAVTTILGCFVVFGAPLIASGILEAVEPGAIDAPYVPPVTMEQPAAMPRISRQPEYDPYAGAAMPVQ